MIYELVHFLLDIERIQYICGSPTHSNTITLHLCWIQHHYLVKQKCSKQSQLRDGFRSFWNLDSDFLKRNCLGLYWIVMPLLLPFDPSLISMICPVLRVDFRLSAHVTIFCYEWHQEGMIELGLVCEDELVDCIFNNFARLRSSQRKTKVWKLYENNSTVTRNWPASLVWMDKV